MIFHNVNTWNVDYEPNIVWPHQYTNITKIKQCLTVQPTSTSIKITKIQRLQRSNNVYVMFIMFRECPNANVLMSDACATDASGDSGEQKAYGAAWRMHVTNTIHP